MKLKEVCEKTGLSRKTIRLYEEKGLLVPQMERINGRDYREYTEADMQKLRTIAMLRRAWFTMDEIKQMLDDPAAIQDIFPQYRQWLRQQKEQLDELVAVAEALELQEVASVEELTECMAAAASKLPLPKYDIQPRFRYLDKLEEGGRAMSKNKTPENWEKPLEGGIKDSRAYRQMVASVSKGKADDLGVAFGQLRDAEKMFQEAGTGPVQREKPEAPRKIRVLRLIALLLMLFFGYVTLQFYLMGAMGTPVVIVWCVFGLTAAAFIGACVAAAVSKKRV